MSRRWSEEEHALLLAFVQVGRTGQAEGEFRALWAERARCLEVAGDVEGAAAARGWVERGRPGGQKR